MVNARRDPDRPRKRPAGGAAQGDASKRSVYSLSEEETFELGRNLAQSLRGGELILLDGDLGMGKTVFTRGIAGGLGIPVEDVSSPSFTLVQEYVGGRLPMFHIDLYRLIDAEDFGTLGLEDVLGGGAVVVVEWGDKLPPYYRREAIVVKFYDVGEDSRQIEIIAVDPDPPTRGGDA